LAATTATPTPPPPALRFVHIFYVGLQINFVDLETNSGGSPIVFGTVIAQVITGCGCRG